MINTSTRSQPTTKKYPSRFKAPPSLLLHPPPSRHCPLPDTDHSIQDYAFLCFQKNKKILHIVFNKYIYIYIVILFILFIFVTFKFCQQGKMFFSKNASPNPLNNFIYYQVKKFGGKPHLLLLVLKNKAYRYQFFLRQINKFYVQLYTCFKLSWFQLLTCKLWFSFFIEIHQLQMKRR